MHKLNALPSLMRSVHLVIAVISIWLLIELAPLNHGVYLVIRIICTTLVGFPSLIMTLVSCWDLSIFVIICTDFSDLPNARRLLRTV